MKQFAPYLIKLNKDDTPRFVRAARKVLASPWHFRRAKPACKDFICFRRDAVAGSPPVILALFRDDDQTLKVSNIVPKEGALSIEQWRAILMDFESSVLHKIREPDLEFVTFMGNDDVNLGELMHPVPWKLLQSLAGLAPKDQNALHPCDHLHFLEFIAALHITGHTLDPQKLGAWFREQGFSLELSGQLEYEFDYHLELLKIYDRIRRALAGRASSGAGTQNSQP